MTSPLDRPHAALKPLLATGAPVYLPVNPVEYHGPHLSLRNDALVSRGLAEALHARLSAIHPEWPFLYADDLEIGVDPTPGPGTRTTPFAEVRAAVLRACEAVASLGAQRVVLMTFHGAPLHAVALEAGVQWLRRRGIAAFNPLNLVLDALLDVDPAPFRAAYDHIPEPLRSELIRDLSLDFHGGFFETSMALHLAPDSVSPTHVELAPCPPIRPMPLLAGVSALAAKAGRRSLANELRLMANGLGWFALRPFPGYTGHPAYATAEAGRIFAAEIVNRYERTAVSVFAGGEPPRPPMPWLELLTLGGRIPGAHVPEAARPAA